MQPLYGQPLFARRLFLLPLLFACQSYEPAPLDLEGHAERFHAPDIELGDRLDFEAGLEIALRFHPDLRLARLRASAAEVSLPVLLEDPELNLEALRVDEDVPDRWTIAPSLAFTLPLPGERRATRDLNAREWDAALAEVRVARHGIEQALLLAWVDWTSIDQELEVTRIQITRIAGLAEAAGKLAEVGEISRLESDLARLDVMALEREVKRLEGQAELARLTLAAAMGLSPEVGFVPARVWARVPEGATDLHGHPRLAVARARYDEAEARLAVAVRQQYPALTLGPAIEEDEGRTKVGGFLGWRLPLWNRNRVAIDRARVERELARAEFEVAYEALATELAEAQQRLEMAESELTALVSGAMPLLEEGVEAARTAMQQGEVTVLVVLEHHRRQFEALRAALQASKAQERARARLIGLLETERSEE